MKGLLVKDLLLMKVQKKFFFLILAVSIFMALSMKDISFVAPYMSSLLSIFALTTISYDELDNGYAFLFTLPVSRKTYVLEKYCLTGLLSICSIALSLIITVGIGALRHLPPQTDLLQFAVIQFLAILLLVSVMLPLQIKFGAEKGRLVLISIIGVLFALGFAVKNLAKIQDFDLLFVITAFIEETGVLPYLLLIAVVLLAPTLSLRASLSAMKKKSF